MNKCPDCQLPITDDPEIRRRRATCGCSTGRPKFKPPGIDFFSFVKGPLVEIRNISDLNG